MKKNITKTVSFLSLLFLVCSQNMLYAVTKISAKSGNFSAGSTWVGGIAPAIYDDIIISTGHTVTLTAAATVFNITIQTGATLNNSIYKLTINSATTGNPIYTNNGIHNGSGNLIAYNNNSTEMSGNGITNCNIEIVGYGLDIMNTCNLIINANIQHAIPGNFGMNGKEIIGNWGGGSLTINGNIITDDQYTVGITNVSGGTIIVNGNVSLPGGILIGAGSTLTNSGVFNISGNLILGPYSGYCQNSGSMIIGGDLLGAFDTYFIQEVNSSVKFGGSVFPESSDGFLFASESPLSGPSEPNTIEYNGNATQYIKLPTDAAYSDLVISNPGINGVISNSGTLVNGTLTINAGAVLTINPGGSVTVAGTIVNIAGNSGLVIKSGGSLIESSSGIAATVESDIAGGEWHLISSPVAGTESGAFTGKYLQMHTEGTNAYTDILLTNVPLTTVKGFALYSDTPFTAQYQGQLNTGGQSSTLSRTTAGIGSGWNLVGNPYPSSIDWAAGSGWTKTHVNNATYIHVNSATWASYVGGTGINGGTRYIAPCQGFFVQVTNGYSSGILAMGNGVKAHNASNFFKSAVNNLIRLQISGNGYTDEAVVRFLPEATSEFDGEYDAHKLFGDEAEAAQLYTLGSTPLSINTLPELNTVPVGMRVNKEGIYTITATEVNDLANVSIEDTKTGIFTDLLKGSYSFSFTTGENEERFLLHFSPLSVNEMNYSLANIYSCSQTVYVDLNNTVKGDIFIYTVAGQLVASVPEAGGSIRINLANTGYYIVKVITDKSTLVKKVWVQ
jgi:hypothetical protein